MFTGISGSYTVAMASSSASSVGRPEVSTGISPSGVQTVFGGVTSFTASLLCAIQRGDQGMPGQRGTFDPGGIFMDTGERRQALDRVREGGIAGRAGTGPGHLTERIEQGSGVGFGASLNGFSHQIGGGDADGAAPSLETDFADAVGVELDPDLNPVAAHRVVALGGGGEVFQPGGVAGVASVIEDDFLIQVAQIVEAVRLGHAKNSRTRVRPSASASISPCVV